MSALQAFKRTDFQTVQGMRRSCDEMCTTAALVALNPHNKLSIFHKYGTTFHSPDSALGRRPLRAIPKASAPPQFLRTRSPPDS